jgi:two-component system response regulator HydG
MTKKSVLIIDDDVDICQLLKRFLERKGFDAKTAFKGNEGIISVQNIDFDLILMDFRLPDYDGIDLIQELKAIKPKIPIIVITGYSDVKQAVKMIQLGAFEYVTKPIFPEEILKLILKAVDQNTSSKTPKEVKKEIDKVDVIKENQPRVKKDTKEEKSYLFGQSTPAKEVIKQIEIVAPTEMTVLLLGESGTGKEVTARMIHNYSKRNDNPFVPVDCGALPKDLAGSELFGHVKGAFTGALSDKKGHFEQAEGGTLFLDEIGNLSYDNQIKLLRALQERKVRRIGADKDIPVNVRIIVATNEDLTEAIKDGRFREDVFYRINEFAINLPPLRHCIDDIMEFANFFLDQSNLELDKAIQGFSSEAKALLMAYNWPGNIREMKNIVKRSTLIAQGNKIEKEDLSNTILEPNTAPKINDELNLKEVVIQAETAAIKKALKLTKNNKSKTARLLGVDRKTLYNKLDQYGIEK